MTWCSVKKKHRDNFAFTSLCNFFHIPDTSSFLHPHILNTLFWNALKLLLFIMQDQVSHPYITTGNITILYSLIFRVLEGHENTRDYSLKWMLNEMVWAIYMNASNRIICNKQWNEVIILCNAIKH
jgi:hypothetical protein